MNPDQNPVDGGQEPSSNMSIEQFIAQRTSAAQNTEPEEPAEVTEEQEPEEAAEEVEETTEEAPEEPTEETDEEETEEDEEGDEFDQLLSLDPDQIKDLAKRGKSRLLQRIGELTAQKRALEEKIQTATADTKPLQPSVAPEDNPFRELKSLDDIQSKYHEMERVAEETDRILEDHEDYAADDIISVGGKEFAKKDIRQANRNARAAMTRFLPAQAQSIQLSAQLEQIERHYEAAIPVEVPDIAVEGSDTAKLYKMMIDDPLIAQVKERVPELAPQVGYLLAHAANSLAKKNSKVKVKATGNLGKAKVPPNPSTAATRSAATPRKEVQDAYKQFEQTGRPEDWIAARIKKHSFR